MVILEVDTWHGTSIMLDTDIESNRII